MTRSLFIVVCLLTFACNRLEDQNPFGIVSTGPVLVEKANPTPAPEGDPIPENELAKTVKNMLIQQGDFRWDRQDLKTLWSAVQYSDQHAVSVGYKPANVGDISETIANIDIQSPEWKAVHDAIIALVVDELNKRSASEITLKDILIEDDTTLPLIVFKLTEKDVITKLYNLQNVRYVEPLGYWYDSQRSSTGCGGSTEPLNALDYTESDPGCKVPWNFASIGVPTAWANAQGVGIKIGVIDAGISNQQTLLGSQFTNGYSTNRNLTTDYTYGSSAYTSCKHGTSMCGLAAGPRNTYGATSGVAYKSNLHFIRACEDVVLDASSEQLGVKNALVKMAKINNLKIISMSIGTPFYSNTLYDGVSFAYGKGKMIFAAAGTSFDWTSWWGVIYPAAFSQCVAVTGVRENSSTCATCHDGSQVKFTVPMERDDNNNRNSLSLDYSGNNPTYIGGSSCATATTAGVAALVWSVNTSLSRTQVYNCLRNTAQYYPNLTSDHGYGNINAAAAVAMAQAL
jgi:serine protease